MTNHTSKKSSGADVLGFRQPGLPLRLAIAAQGHADILGFLQEAGLASAEHTETAEISVDEQANLALANLERSGQTDLAARLRAEFNGEAPSPDAQPSDSETHDDEVIGFLQKAGLVSKSAS